ncbi:fimbrial protein [Salmonella enterica subsp. enterica]|nr:fimbrial protein [Salmonella enterica subsp. enterica]EDW9588871.1 fimbrial protein [Salmonella enterica subsp. enterica]EED9671612.1 fimbrial protein [Salmonella enterica subsp. enterica]EIO7468728.1 fimbrial protein [Salmonella enterica subsp. enterica]EIY5764474.1 fimbrial protein [Salmonella enterica subsp. enterica]
MRIHRVVNALAMAGTLFPPLCLAAPNTQGLSLDFTAVIEETTCVMKVSSLSNISVSGSDTQYALTVPNIGLSELLNATNKTEGNFKILPQECNNAITSITMSVKGTTLSNTSFMLKNSLTGSGNAENVGLGFKPQGSQDGDRLRLDGTVKTDWTPDQITNGMDMTAFFRRASSSLTPTTGDFQAKATFTFTYK